MNDQCRSCGSLSILVETWAKDDPVPRVLPLELCWACAQAEPTGPSTPGAEAAR